jgi:hypothetical protein
MQQLIFLIIGTCIVFFILWLITQFLDVESGYGLYVSLVLFSIMILVITIIMASSIQAVLFRR